MPALQTLLAPPPAPVIPFLLPPCPYFVITAATVDVSGPLPEACSSSRGDSTDAATALLRDWVSAPLILSITNTLHK